MKKVLLYSIWVLWAIIIFANILRFFGNESMVAVLDSVPELSYLQQQFVKTPMFLIELGAGLLLITRCRSYKVLLVAIVTAFLAGFVASPIENIYLCSVAYLVCIVYWTDDPKAATQEAVILVALYTLYGVLTQLGRFTFDLASYKNYTVQLLSCIDYKLMPLLALLYAKYYNVERRLSLCGIFRAVRSCSAMKMLRSRTSANADSSK